MFLLGPLTRLFAKSLRQASKDLAREAGRPPEAPEKPVERVSEPDAIQQPPKPSAPVEGRKINDAGLELIKSFEGLRLKAYRCPANVWTVGYGHTRTAKKGMVISEAEADELLLEDLETFERGVDELLGQTPTHPNEFAAMTSLAFNIGLAAFARSTVLKRHRNKNKVGAANAFLLWNRGGGQVLPGLMRRREAERSLYLA